MKRDYLINLNTAVDIIWDLRESGKIDRETESLFVHVLYQTRDNKKRNKKLQLPKDRLPEYTISRIMQEIYETLGRHILGYESIIKNLLTIKIESQQHEKKINYVYYLLNRCTQSCLDLRENILSGD